MRPDQRYYHIRFRLAAPHKEVALLDLSLNEVVGQYVWPFRAREPLRLGGQVIYPRFVEAIHISYSTVASAERLTELRTNDLNSLNGGGTLPAEWRLAAECEEVTDDLMGWSAERLGTGPRIFVNYRRGGSESAAAHLADSLRRQFGEDRVFFDVADIEPGSSWPSALSAALEAADVVVAVLDEGWLRAQDDRGRRRLDHEGDWVRTELRLAFEGGRAVFPVGIGGVVDLEGAGLPADIEQLENLQQAPVRHSTWDSDVARLTAAIRRPQQGGVRVPSSSRFTCGGSVG